MKLLSGAVLVLAAEQAFAHAHIVQFPNLEAARVLLPASLVLLVVGSLLFVWGLLTEARGSTSQRVASTSPVNP